MKLSVVAGAVGVMGLLAAAVGLGGPYWVGLRSEHYYDTAFRDSLSLNGIPPEHAVFRRGWFDSSSRITVEIPGAAAHARSSALSLVSHIRHGPLLYEVAGSPELVYAVVDTTVELPHALEGPLRRYFGDREPVRATTVVAFDGTSKTYISSPLVKGVSRSGDVHVDWRGLDGRLTTSHGDAYALHLSMPRVIIRNGGGEFDVASVETSARGRKLSGGLWQSASTLSLGKMDLHPSGAKGRDRRFSLSGLSFSENVVPKAGTLSAHFDARLAGLAVDDRRFGPGRYTVEVRNISRSALARYKRVMQTAQALHRQGLRGPQILARLGARVAGLAGEFLKKSPQVEISRLSLNTAQGEVQGRLLVTFDGSGPFNVSDVGMLMGRLHARGRVAMPAEVFKALLAGVERKRVTAALRAGGPDMPDGATVTAMTDAAVQKELRTLTQGGLISTAGGQYSANVTYENGRLRVNGRPVGAGVGL